jgi:FlaA1/EpsC-like NDP-sugar epimerase
VNSARHEVRLSAAELTGLVTGRRGASLFTEVVDAHLRELTDVVRGSRVLFTGGAGTIGSATIAAVAALKPKAIHVVDCNENSLVELVRDLRSRREGLFIDDFRTFPLDFGSPAMRCLIRNEGPYDTVFHFAAHKHVRSERDLCSVVQVLDTNVVKGVRLLRWLADNRFVGRIFMISTDKAADPVTVMGATKRVLEHVVLSGETASLPNARVVVARFANVAFSAGSLLDGILKRIEKRQPIAVPSLTTRYFLSNQEAAELCLLAGFLGPHRHIVIPTMGRQCSRDLESVAVDLVRAHGFEPIVVGTEDEARRRAHTEIAQGRWPFLITTLDTASEKLEETFVAVGERQVDVGLAPLVGIPYSSIEPDAIRAFVKRAERIVARPEQIRSKEQITKWLETLMPEFRHKETERYLDNHM